MSSRMIVFGGSDGVTTYGDVRSYDPATDTWTTISTTGGPARYFHTAIYDSKGRRMIVFGGYGTGSANPWALSLTSFTWSELVPNGTPPGPKAEHVAIYDPVGNAMIVTGGAPADLPQETWRLSLATSPPAWTRLQDFIDWPTQGATAIYDPVATRMIMTGGRMYRMGTLCSVTRYGEEFRTWALSLGTTPTWSQITTTGTSLVGSYATSFYEPRCRSLVVYGGVTYSQDCSGCIFGQGACELQTNTPVPYVRILNLNTNAWTAPSSTTGGPPTARGYHSLAFDVNTKRAYVYGGGSWYETYDYDHHAHVPHNTVLADTWTLQMPQPPDAVPPNAVMNLTVASCTMSQLTLAWNAPADDDGSTVAGYEIRSSSDPIDDTNWSQATPVSGPPAPTAPGTLQTTTASGLSSCTWYYFALKSFDASSNYSLASNSAGGRTKCTSIGPCYTDLLRSDPVESGAEPGVLELGRPLPNPARAELLIRYMLPPGAETATLGIYDLIGRRVAEFSAGATRGGTFERQWDLRDTSGRRVAKGLYWVRLAAGGEVRRQAVVVN